MEGVLSGFCSQSGQKVNVSKSKMFVSKNTPGSASNISISLSSDLGLYLGMPLIHSRVRSRTYGFLLTKVRRRLSGWKMRQLSMAARSLFIQSVVSTIPSYAMQTAKIPFYLINWKRPCVSSSGQRTRIAAGCILWHGVRFALQKP